jgi:hypothetical protein
MTVLQYLMSIHNFGKGGFWSMENPKTQASNSELRRWIKSNALYINGHPVTAEEEIDYPLHRVVLFPKNDRKRISLL